MQHALTRRQATLAGTAALAAGIAAGMPGGAARALAAEPGVPETGGDGGAGDAARPQPDARFGDVGALEEGLAAAGCTVQRGSLRELDTLKLASEGMLVSCFGNNAGSYYLVAFLPPAPGQDPAAAVEARGWPAEEPGAGYVPGAEGNYPANPYFSPVGWSFKLRPDEAVILAGTVPPDCVYFSLANYVLLAADMPGKDYTATGGYLAVPPASEDEAPYHPVFGSIGMPVNRFGIATEATPGQAEGPVDEARPSPFGSRFVYVVSGDAGTYALVAQALEEAGFGEGVVNRAPLPAASLAMGLEAGRDTFCILGRISQPADHDAMDAWSASLPETMTVLRVTPGAPGAAPLGPQPIATRGTGVHELEAVPAARARLDAIRAALIAQYGGEYDYEEPTVDIAVPEGATGYLNDRNCQGDNHDAAYVMTSDFSFGSDEDFAVVYGVNHTATGKAVYSNAILYARPMLNGVCSVYDGLFAGSAAAYLPEDAQDEAGLYYVYKMARPGWPGTDAYTAEVPFSTGNEQGAYYGTDNGSAMLAAFRAYIERGTGVGPSYYEMVWDRAIVFHKGRA